MAAGENDERIVNSSSSRIKRPSRTYRDGLFIRLGRQRMQLTCSARRSAVGIRHGTRRSSSTRNPSTTDNTSSTSKGNSNTNICDPAGADGVSCRGDLYRGTRRKLSKSNRDIRRTRPSFPCGGVSRSRRHSNRRNPSPFPPSPELWRSPAHKLRAIHCGGYRRAVWFFSL
jgi:hypothetical protein